ncbi:MAG: diphosphatase [Solirubrobacteraceae bacterium]|nr:diphosphatase [Solirubrobacteraceae bacterium]
MPDPITFAGGTLDRAAHRRTDAGWLDAAHADPRALAVVGGRRGVLLDGEAPALVGLDGREGVFLGVRDGAPLWAVEAIEGEELADLRLSVGRLSDDDAGLLAYAQSLLHWHRTHRFCGRCGAPLTAIEAGFARRCENDHVVHPRTDPVVIMLVVDGDRALLGRQSAWPEGRYSALAGFVEPGESLEAAVAREVREEAGIEVGEVRYRASQPWPFPASLMIGFEADYAAGSVQADEDELEDARWFTRAEMDDGDLILPPRMAIARRLIEAWLA